LFTTEHWDLGSGSLSAGVPVPVGARLVPPRAPCGIIPRDIHFASHHETPRCSWMSFAVGRGWLPGIPGKPWWLTPPSRLWLRGERLPQAGLVPVPPTPAHPTSSRAPAPNTKSRDREKEPVRWLIWARAALILVSK